MSFFINASSTEVSKYSMGSSIGPVSAIWKFAVLATRRKVQHKASFSEKEFSLQEK
jgi:hypothetical protein